MKKLKTLPYNEEKILDKLSKLQIEQKGNTVFTYFDNRLISNSDVTDIYQVFDFATFAKNITPKVKEYFTPNEYLLRIVGGVQELRLIGDAIDLNGEKYLKMFNILNSTDNSRALQCNIGLIRFICSNGMVIADKDNYAGFKVKHYVEKLDEKVDIFLNQLPNFNIEFEKQLSIINQLNNKFVSFKEIAAKLALDEDGVINDSRANKLRAFSKKLLTSETDRLEVLNNDQIKLLNNSTLFQNSEFDKIDVEITANKVVNCWTEVYRNYDSSVIKRETNRIIELV